jgi:hypothetical protein
MQILIKSLLFCLLYQVINFPSSAQTINQSQLKLLEKAYHQKSLKKLDKFFDNWQKEIPPISDSELNTLKPIQQEAYRVFEAFYQPTQLENIGGYEFGSNNYKNLKYCVIQNRVNINTAMKIIFTSEDSIEVLDNLFQTRKIDSINDKGYFYRKNGKIALTSAGKDALDHSFYSQDSLVDSLSNLRPRINCIPMKIVFLSEKYDILLSQFLGEDYWRINGKGKIKSTGPSFKKQQFFRNYIKIWFANGWRLHSDPIISTISFDKTYSRALVRYSITYSNNDAILEKTNGQWEIKKIIFRSIE